MGTRDEIIASLAKQPQAKRERVVVHGHKLPEPPAPKPNPWTDWLAVGPAEEAVIWASMVDGEYRRRAMLAVCADDFSAIWRRQVWEAMMELQRQRKPVDLATLKPRLEWATFMALWRVCYEVRNPYEHDYTALVAQAAELRRAAMLVLTIEQDGR